MNTHKVVTHFVDALSQWWSWLIKDSLVRLGRLSLGFHPGRVQRRVQAIAEPQLVIGGASVFCPGRVHSCGILDLLVFCTRSTSEISS